MVHLTNVALRFEDCISYEFFFSLDQKEKILLVQEWQSVEAAERYYRTPTIQLLTDELPEILSGKIETKAYTKSGTNGQVDSENVFNSKLVSCISDASRTLH